MVAATANSEIQRHEVLLVANEKPAPVNLPPHTSNNPEQHLAPLPLWLQGTRKTSEKWKTIFVPRDLIDVDRKMCRLDLILVTTGIHQIQAAFAG